MEKYDSLHHAVKRELFALPPFGFLNCQNLVTLGCNDGEEFHHAPEPTRYLSFVQGQHGQQTRSECHAKWYVRQISERQVNPNTKADQSK